MPTRPRVLHDLLDHAAQDRPHAWAVGSATHRLTYAQLRGASHAAAAWLAEHGVRRGDRVLVQSWNSVYLPAFLYAASRLGAVLVPLSAEMRPYQLSMVHADAAPRLVLVDGASASGMAAAGVARDVHVIEDVWPRLRSGGNAPAGVRVATTDLALLIYTSGSTSAPKGVMCPHAQVLFASSAVAARLRYTADDRVFLRLPMSFDYGLYQLFLCCLSGAELYVADQHSGVGLLGELAASGATVVPVVPSMAGMLNQLADRRGVATRVRMFTNTGAALPRATIARLRHHFPDATIVLMYGITECKRVSIAEPDADLTDPLSLGPPLPGTDVIVVDDHGEPVPVGTTGQLVVRGPHVMSGYWRAPELTRQRFRPDPVTGGTLLFTGDYGSVSDAGDLRFVGRRDDIIKRRGTRVSTLEVEAAALDVPGVEDAAAMVGLPSDELLLFASGTVEQQALVNGLADRLEFAKRPDRCVVVDRLPLGPNGKADRTALGALVTAAPGSERGTHHDVRA